MIEWKSYQEFIQACKEADESGREWREWYVEYRYNDEDWTTCDLDICGPEQDIKYRVVIGPEVIWIDLYDDGKF